MRPDNVLQLVLGLSLVSWVVGQNACDSTQAKDAVGDQHAPLVSKVKVPEDVLRARYQYPHVGIVLRRGERNISCLSLTGLPPMI